MGGWFRENIERMAGYEPGFQPADRNAIKLNTNENPYPPSPRVFEALAQLDGLSLRRYPAVLWNDLRSAAAELHGVAPECVACGNGGDELLALLVRACCGPGRALAYPTPTYSLYPTLAAMQEAPVREYAFGPGGELPEGLSGAEAPLTIVCNPNAPTGTFAPVEEVAALARRAKGIVLIDEAYVDFAAGNCLELLGRHENVAILRSLSKGYSLAGMRVGYLLGSRRIIETTVKVKDSYNVSAAAQAAGAAALRDQGWFSENRRRIRAERERLTAGLRELGFEAGKSHTNFLWAGIVEPPARAVYEELARHNIYVRYFAAAGQADRLRITVGTPEQNDALLAALRAIRRGRGSSHGGANGADHAKDGGNGHQPAAGAGRGGPVPG